MTKHDFETSVKTYLMSSLPAWIDADFGDDVIALLVFGDCCYIELLAEGARCTLFSEEMSTEDFNTLDMMIDQLYEEIGRYA